MDIHRPKPVHSLNDLVGEIGVIVLGVLIALGAEQGVEMLHWRHQVAEARVAMKAELTDNVSYAFAHRAIYACNAKALDHLRQALLKSGPAWKGQPPRYEALRFAWDTSKWRTAQASGTLAHMNPQEMDAFAQAYQFPQQFSEDEARAQDDAAEIGLLAYDQSLADGTRARMLAAVSRADRENWLITIGAKQFLESAGALGATLSDHEKQRMQSQIDGPDGCFARPKTG